MTPRATVLQAVRALRERKAARVRAARVGVCDLCAAALGAAHEHLVDPRTLRLHCACDACVRLFGYGGPALKRVRPRLGAPVPVDDATAAGLGLPVDLAFCFWSTRTCPEGRPSALLPSAAGLTEAPVDEAGWRDLVALRPDLATMPADTEGILLTRRADGPRDTRIASIDVVFRLAALLRRSSTDDPVARFLAGEGGLHDD